MLIRIPPSWHLPESAATPEWAFHRRRFLAMAAGAILLPGCDADTPLSGVGKYPGDVKRNKAYTLDRKLTRDVIATGFNNYYEFTTDKERVWKLARGFKTRPWQIEIKGLAKKTGAFDVTDLLRKLPVEERTYRFRCVETWAMAVPWIGIPMRAFLKWVEPNAKAKYVRFWTVDGRKEYRYDGAEWARQHFPYYEAIRLDEASNELTLLATGIYGRVLPPQNGAPLRLIVPWKYGFKSCKSIARIEFVEKRPRTFWNTVQGREYGFFANVNPQVPHPRWSQATERMIPGSGRIPTLMFNGYGEQVAGLYKGMDLAKNF